MLRIRLRRVGKKGKPSYRIVVAEASAPRDGAYVEWIGNYDPMADPPDITLKRDRAVQWLSQGAQPSDAVRRILDRDGILERTPKFRTPDVVSEAPEGTPAPTVTITRAPAPATAEEEPEVSEVAVAEEEPEVSEEAVAEESAEEVIDQETPSDALEDETEGDAPEDETEGDAPVGETGSDAPEDETEDEAPSE